MSGVATSSEDILHFLHDCAEGKQGCVLVTLTGIEGSSPRAIGAQMAVAANGDYVGSFSGGCIEAAVVAEALEALAEARSRLVRFGLGSPYLDIRLPCGGGIDLLFNPNPNLPAIAQVIAHLKHRAPAALVLSTARVRMEKAERPTGWRGSDFVVTYTPGLRIIAMGQGEELTAVARMCHAFGARVQAFSPSQRDVLALIAQDIEAGLLKARTAPPAVQSDAWTAIVLLFHDRDWEEALIPYALRLPKFYIGALGSRRTHATRTEMLSAAGVSREALKTLRAPVGLIPSTRDPAALAASILAEIVQSYATDAGLTFMMNEREYQAG